MLPGWWCCHVLVLFSLQSRQQGLPQWILSHFRQAPPLTDHTAAFKSLNEHQRQLCDFAFLSEHYNLWSVPPLMKSPAPLVPTAIFNDFPKTHSGFSGTVHHSGRVKWDPLLHYLFSLFMMHVYLLWGSGGWCESGGKKPEPEITALGASMTVWLAALHKILFTAHTEEKLQEQSSPEAGKSADLATLWEGPGGGSGTIIIILLPLIHCRYLYCSHSLWGIQPTGDNRLLVHKRMIKRQ